MLVVDTSVVLKALVAGDVELEALPDPELVAPPLLWSEARSALHEAVFRRELPSERGTSMTNALDRCRIASLVPDGLGAEAWRIADALGWAKTYDAEFCALASLLRVKLVTLDARLRRGADRLGFVIGPTEI